MPEFKFDPELIRAMFENWCPFPSAAYCKNVGWDVNQDGTVDTPGGFRVPTRERWEEGRETQRLEVEELERLYRLGQNAAQ